MSIWPRIFALEAKLDEISYYELLGLSPNVAGTEILRRYYELATKLHPDRHAKASERELAALNRVYARLGEARRILTSASLRSEYDAKLDKGVRRFDNEDPGRKRLVETRDPRHPMARQLYEQGIKLLESNEYARAKSNLELAYQYEPSSPAIREAIERCTSKAGSGRGGPGGDAVASRSLPVAPMPVPVGSRSLPLTPTPTASRPMTASSSSSRPVIPAPTPAPAPAPAPASTAGAATKSANASRGLSLSARGIGTGTETPPSARGVATGTETPAPSRAADSRLISLESRSISLESRSIPLESRSSPFARSEPRHPIAIPIRVKMPSWEHFETLLTRDISRGGMFLKTTRAFELGAVLDLTVISPDGTALDLPAEVVRVVTADAGNGQPPGLGLRFQELSATTAARIDGLLGRAPRNNDPAAGDGDALLGLELKPAIETRPAVRRPATEPPLQARPVLPPRPIDYTAARALLAGALRQTPEDGRLKAAFYVAVGMAAKEGGLIDEAHAHFATALIYDAKCEEAIRELRALG